MLRVVKNAKNQPYLAKAYDGAYGDGTRDAISKFQDEQKIGVAFPDPKASAPVTLTKDQEWKGTMRPGGPSITKLSAMLPPDYKTIRIMPDTKTAYVEGKEADAKKSAKDIRGDGQLDKTFKEKVAKLVDAMYDRYKVVLWIAPQGGRRTFAEQAALDASATGAGPGESNHQFGRAVDMGYRGLNWVTGNGPLKKHNDWLASLAKESGAKAQEMWEARNLIAFDELGLFKTNKKGDLIHVQAYDDGKVHMGASLANLLNTVGKMKWGSAFKNKHNQYSSNLDGKTLQDVGRAIEIWNGEAPVKKEMIAKAKSDSTGKAVDAATVTEKDIKDMQTKLQDDFKAADQNWQKWQVK
jgi:hypothetical protein